MGRKHHRFGRRWRLVLGKPPVLPVRLQLEQPKRGRPRRGGFERPVVHQRRHGMDARRSGRGRRRPLQHHEFGQWFRCGAVRCKRSVLQRQWNLDVHTGARDRCSPGFMQRGFPCGRHGSTPLRRSRAQAPIHHFSRGLKLRRWRLASWGSEDSCCGEDRGCAVDFARRRMPLLEAGRRFHGMAGRVRAGGWIPRPEVGVRAGGWIPAHRGRCAPPLSGHAGPWVGRSLRARSATGPRSSRPAG